MVENNPRHLDSIFRALADPTRRDMLRRLSFGEHTVGELAEPFDISLAAVSKHIRVLEGAGLVNRTVSGRTHVFRLSPARFAEATEWLRHYERFWNVRLDALRRALNEGEADG